MDGSRSLLNYYSLPRLRVFINALTNYMVNSNKGYKEVNKVPRNKGKFVPKSKVPMINLTLRLPAPTIEWIEAEAEKRGLSKTDVVREMLSKQIPV